MAAAYVVKEKESVGRYMVAGHDLKAGEEILTEDPFVIGPKYNTYLQCLGCYTPLEEVLLCEKCSWPICSTECSENPWHKNFECEVFSKCGAKFQDDDDPTPQLECITPLRLLLQSETCKDRWEKEVNNMVSHTELRKKNEEEWNAEQVNVVNFLRNICKLNDRFSNELIEKACGILEVNSYEIVTPQMCLLRGIYPKTALLSHNCVANTIHSTNALNNFRLQLRTTVDVKEGDELFSSYTSSLYPTIVRRARLKATKYFDCSCARCSDPKELGTHMGTLKCTKCDNGVILSTNPLDGDAPWKCTQCSNGITGLGVQRVYEAMQAEIDKLEQMPMSSERLELTEKVLRSYKSILHPHNGFNVVLWHTLSQMYGHTDGYTLDMLPDLLLERKSKFCKDLLDLLDVVEPGYTRIRGLTLYEYHVGLLLYSRSRYEYKEINAEQLRKTAQEVITILEECSKILSLEPECTPEAMLADTARQSIAQLRESMANLKD